MQSLVALGLRPGLTENGAKLNGESGRINSPGQLLRQSLRRTTAHCALLLVLPGLAAFSRAQTARPDPAGSAVSAQSLPDAPDRAATGTVCGAVMGTKGEVYSGVRVTLAFSGNQPSPARTLTTNDDGGFCFTGLPAGDFELTAASGGFVTQAITGSLGAGETFDAHDIVLPVAEATSDVRVTASQTEIAEAQLYEEEQQRVLGVLPNFYVVYDQNAAPLTPKQKYRLAWKSNFDIVTFGMTAATAGVEQADDDYTGYGQGTAGYAKRFGAAYGDAVIGTMLGNAVLPSIFKQDPRYFYKGTGGVRARAWYAIYNSFMCKGDNGHWQFAYSAIGGGLIAAGISNLYYPSDDRNGVSLTFENAGIGIGTSAVENLLQEFLIKKLTPRAKRNSGSQP